MQLQGRLRLNMLLNAINGIMKILFPLVSFPYASKILGVENIGKYNFSVSIISYINLIAGLGIGTYAIREGARIRESKTQISAFASEIFSINVFSTTFAYIILFFMIVSSSKLHQYAVILLVLSIQVGFGTIGVSWVYSIYEDYLYMLICGILCQCASIVLLFLLVHNTKDLLVYAAINVVSSAGVNIFSFFNARKYCRIQLIKHIQFSKHIKPIMVLFAMSMTITIYVSSDTTILGYLCDDYTVGIYSVSTKIYSIVKQVLSSALIVSIPRLSLIWGKNDKEVFDNVASDIYKILLTALVPAVIGMILLSNEIIRIISDETYLRAVSSFIILSIALLFCMCAWFWGQCILVPMKMENIVFKATVLSAIVNLVLNFLLIPLWEENAAAFTTLLAQLIAYIWCLLSGRKYVKLKRIGLTMVKIVIGCVGIFIICLTLRLLKLNMILYTVISVGASVVVYIAIEISLKNEAIIEIINEIKNKSKAIKF